MSGFLRSRARQLLPVLVAIVGTLLFVGARLAVPRLTAQASNPIPAENALPGNPPSEWDVVGSGDATIQGFATDISVNKGGSIGFKVTTTAATFAIDIYRLGYYQGTGARTVATIPGVTGQSQPACLSDAATGLYDCGNWALSATWNVPATSVSGIYIAKITRSGGGASHIPFVVRDDAAQADILLQTDDTTWQAYNQYGGHSLYLGSPIRGYKASYNRPFATRSQSTGYGKSNYVFYAEYPMLRFLEQNGYNVKYWSGVDTDRIGAALIGSARPKVFLTVGHDEYWSGPQRTNVEAARAAGVNLAFFSGNDVFWKTRWETSIDGTGTPYRTLVTYKETHDNAVKDPAGPATWTGTWRDPRFSPPGDGGRPENALTGTIFTVNRGSAPITVPGIFANLRFWRNTAVAALSPTQSLTLALDTIGYEWNEDLDNGYRPAGAFQLSSTIVNVPERVQDSGSTYLPGIATHSLVMYRHASGALVFGAGTVQWVWGLDTHHDIDSDFGSTVPDTNMQQATVNLLADMGAQPDTIMSLLLPATKSTDTTKPASTITSPVQGAAIPAGTVVTVAGTASDVDGVVAGVEVSTDGGTTWHRANGTSNWTYAYAPGVLGPATILSRAADDSGNIEQPAASVGVSIVEATCPCSVFVPSLSTPWMLDSSDAAAVELGMKFTSDVGGVVNGVRFYKAPTNTGTHTGHLWTSAGALLATVTFSGESASGWQQANFASAVPIQANSTYVISYFAPNGHYSDDQYYFGKKSINQWPLHGLKNGLDGGNGVFNYLASGFPSQTWFSDSYWVDVVFTPELTPPTVSLTSPTSGASITGNAVSVTATASDNLGVAGVQFQIDGANLGAEDTASPYSVSWNSVLAANGTHTLTAVARDLVGNLATSAPVTVTVANVDTIAPTVSVTSPLNTATVRGSMTLTASASDNQGVAGVQFLVDGAIYGPELTSPPYTMPWDASALVNNSTHTIQARARDTSNLITTSTANTVTILNPVAGAPVVDAAVWIDDTSPSTLVASPPFSTGASNELVLAFIATDYLGGANTTVTGVTGAGLTWTLVGRTNVQFGTSEVWRAFASSPISNGVVTATLSQSVTTTMQVVSFSNVDTSGTNGSGAIGATASANAIVGAPSATLTTTRDNSWVFGVGNDFDQALARTAGANQVLVHQALPPIGDTYWIQRTLNPIALSGTSVTINDTAPTGDRYNLFICEIRALNTPDTTAPTVSMTAPAGGSTATGTITVSASASDNVGVAGVQFKLDGANIGAEDTASPYSITWNSVTASNGTHALTAVARDAAGNTTTSAAVSITVDNDTTPPVVAITSPAAGSAVSATVTVVAGATDNVGVAGVQFKLDGANLGAEVTTAPYQVAWTTTTVANGPHTLTAVARDAAANTTTSASVSVTVNNADATPPTVSMTAPAAGATIVGTVALSASASDNIAVVGVQFKVDGVNLGAEDTASPYTINWDSKTAANGAHSLTAVARDGAGNTTTSAAVSVTVNNDLTAPTVSVTSPAAGAIVSGAAVSVTATAADNVGVVGVQFLLDGIALGTEVTASPYSVSWNTASAANGSHALSARARDAAGNITTSAAVTVTVSNISTGPPVIDALVFADQGTASATVTSPAFSTTSGNQLLLAMVGTDYLSGTNTTVTGVTGGGLTWVLVGRTNVQLGTAEIWRAFAPSPLTNVQVTATMSQAVWSSMQVMSFSNVDTSGTNGSGAIGAIASANSPGGAPSATLVTTRANSYVVGVGSDFDQAISHTIGANQTLTHQFLSPSGDTYWMQRTTNAVAALGTSVTINDTAPAGDRYNLFIAEIRTSGAPDTIAPTVSITAPADGATVSGSATVTASASDNVGVAGVQFKLDGVNLGAEDTASPYQAIWNTLTAVNGTHALTAVARDAAGNTTTSTAITVTVNNDTTAPTVSITAPVAAATVSGTTSVSADAADNTAVVGVQFKLDGANLGAEVTVAPYVVSWNTGLATNGAHVLTAVARDAAGNSTTSAAISVTVNNADATPPVVTMTAPVDASTVVGTVAVSATASDNIAVVGVQFRLDGVNLGAEDTAAPYTINWDSKTAANGTHALTAVARDGAGNTTTAAAVTVTVNNDLTAPTVSMTAPLAGATVSGAATPVSATASDNVAVAGVQFLLDGVALGAEVTTAPYSFSWNTATSTNGAHTLSARARDAAGNTTTSAAVSVTVSNVASGPPVVDVTIFKDQETASKTVVSSAFSTAQPNELLLAFVATDYITGTNTSVSSVTGGGLTWVLVGRTNAQRGTSEIWRAFAPAKLTGATVTATLSQTTVASMTLMTFSNVDATGTNGSGAIGAVTSANKASGAPIATLVTTRANSLVFGVGNDFDGATARTVGAGQTMIHEVLSAVGDTYWVQRLAGSVATTGTTVTINDTAPTTHRFNLTICEIRAPQ